MEEGKREGKRGGGKKRRRKKKELEFAVFGVGIDDGKVFRRKERKKDLQGGEKGDTSTRQ